MGFELVTILGETFKIPFQIPFHCAVETASSAAVLKTSGVDDASCNVKGLLLEPAFLNV